MGPILAELKDELGLSTMNAQNVPNILIHEFLFVCVFTMSGVSWELAGVAKQIKILSPIWSELVS